MLTLDIILRNANLLERTEMTNSWEETNNKVFNVKNCIQAMLLLFPLHLLIVKCSYFSGYIIISWINDHDWFLLSYKYFE